MNETRPNNDNYDLAIWETYLDRVRDHTSVIRDRVNYIRFASGAVGFHYPLWPECSAVTDLENAETELRKLADDIRDTRECLAKVMNRKVEAEKRIDDLIESVHQP
jgi:hypothetical protein